MHFPEKFYRLPLDFDHKKLFEEIEAVDGSHWSPHPQAFKGNDALILLSNGGTINDLNYGAMEFTPCMEQLPYLKQVLESFNTVIGRTRLMRLAPGEKVGRHSDVSLYWWHRFRIHVPIVTHPEVKFYCEDTHVHMQAGEAWTFDNWRYHEVHNNSDITRVHLVIDTVGSPEIWQMLENESWHPQPGETLTPNSFHRTFIPFDKDKEASFEREQHNIIGVLSPAELDAIANFLSEDLNTDLLSAEQSHLTQFYLRYLKRAWRAFFSIHGRDENYYQDYSNLLLNVVASLNTIEPKPTLKSNGFLLANVLKTQVSLTIQDVITKQTKEGKTKPFVSKTIPLPKVNLRRPLRSQEDVLAHSAPIFIVSAPCAGGAFVENLLSNSLSVDILETDDKQTINNRILTKYHPEQLDDTYEGILPKKAIQLISHRRPRNNPDNKIQSRRVYFDDFLSLRIKSLLRTFPNAQFIYVFQDPIQNLIQLKADWEKQAFDNHFASEKVGQSWHHPLPHGWHNINLTQLDDCLSFQYIAINQSIMNQLSEVPPASVFCLDFQALSHDLAQATEMLCNFCQIPYGPKMQSAAQRSLPDIEVNSSILQNSQSLQPSLATYEHIQQWAKARKL